MMMRLIPLKGFNMSDTARCLKKCEPRQGLLKASQRVENTAFDIALTHPSKMVSELIVIAADLERLALLIGSQED
jgi:hypothetical protein